MANTTFELGLHEICECEGVSESVVIDLVKHEIAIPSSGESSVDWVFDSVSATWVRKAIRLHRDLDLEWVAVAMVIDLLRQRERLEGENRTLRQRLERFALENQELPDD